LPITKKYWLGDGLEFGNRQPATKVQYRLTDKIKNKNMGTDFPDWYQAELNSKDDVNHVRQTIAKHHADDTRMDFGGWILGEVWAKRLLSQPDCWYHNDKKVSILDLHKKWKQCTTMNKKIIAVPSRPNRSKPHVVRSGNLRPCDCKDSVDTSQLHEQGIGHNDESIMVCPNHVLLTMGHTTIKIGMARFKMFAEWYLGVQG